MTPCNHSLTPDAAGDIQWLASLSQDFAASLSMPETLDNAIARIMSYLEVEAASIFLLDPGEATLTCLACAGAVDIRGLTVANGQGIVGRAVSSGQSQLVRDVATDGDFSGAIDALTGFRTRSILCAPLQVKGRKLGALEVINKRAADANFDADDCQLLQALAGVVSLAIHNARMAEALLEQERMRRDLDLAREIQRGLLPQSPPGFPVCAINLPALEVSGDFYDFFPLPDGRIVWGLGDVSGKGMNAALLMAKTISLFRCLGKREPDIGRLLADLNDEIAETALFGMFVTMVLGTYEPASGAVRLVNAGHQPPLLRRRDGSYAEFAAAGPPLGVLPGMSYEAVALQLDGGRLFVFTDGVTEGLREDGSMLGLAGLQAIFDAHAGAAASDQLAAVADTLQAGGRRLRDDLTLLAIAPPPLLDREFPAESGVLAEVRATLEAALNGVGLAAEAVGELVLAVNEACMNIIQHGYAYAEGQVFRLRLWRDAGMLQVHLLDHGRPARLDDLCPRALDELRPGGLGVHFMRQLSDGIAYLPPPPGYDNLLQISKRLKA